MSSAQLICMPKRRTGFTPLSLGADLGLYLDGQDPDTWFQDVGLTIPATNGDPMGGWLDKSQYVLNGFQATPAMCPVIDFTGANGLPSPVYDGADMINVLSAIVGLTTFEIWIVASTALLGTYQVLYETYNGTFANCVFNNRAPGGDVMATAVGAAAQTSVSNITPLVDANLHIFRHVVDTTTATACSVITMDGVIVGSQSADDDLLSSVMSAAPMTIGIRYDTTFGAIGAIAEVIVARKRLSAIQSSGMLGYLQTRWNL